MGARLRFESLYLPHPFSVLVKVCGSKRGTKKERKVKINKKERRMTILDYSHFFTPILEK